MPLAPINVEDGTGKADANALCSVDDVDVYFEGHPSQADWHGLEPPTKEARIIAASRIARELRWRGGLVKLTQAMPWPRYGLADQDGRTVAHTSIPDVVKYGLAELARMIGTANVADGTGERVVVAESVGPISYTYGDRRGGADSSGLPSAVTRWWGQFLDYSRPLVRV